MMEYFYNLRDEWIQNFEQFRTGFIAAICCFLIIVVIFYIFQFMTRKRVREIIIPGEKGALVISASAVANMVHAIIANQFKSIIIKKITLWKGNRGIVMEMQGEYDIDGGRLPEVANGMREVILNNLDGQLGITTIKEVIPNIKKITAVNLRNGNLKK